MTDKHLSTQFDSELSLSPSARVGLAFADRK